MQTPHFPVPFVKMSGTGNDFILIDHRKPLLAPEAMADFAAQVCRRKFSVGADGLILIEDLSEDSSAADFQWKFFNADGSVAEMCGNGARCAARFAFLQGIAPAEMRFVTLAGIIEASVSAKDVAVKMTDPVGLKMNQRITAERKEYTVHSIDTGVPHAVVFVDDIEQTDVRTLGNLIRHHQAFMPAGTNVNFAQVQGNAININNNAIKVRTYERGVEDETLACGTGAAACAIIAALLDQAASPVDIITSGNDQLTIVFDCTEENGKNVLITNVFLKGPAHTIYSGKLDAEALL
ncbi:MAG: diaminopimelate epimerase [Candidatus Electrothrix sp. LOE1_4_5]|nr:diaminopimelate epimerase [Candidatus Electrothrix gigas]